MFRRFLRTLQCIIDKVIPNMHNYHRNCACKNGGIIFVIFHPLGIIFVIFHPLLFFIFITQQATKTKHNSPPLKYKTMKEGGPCVLIHNRIVQLLINDVIRNVLMLWLFLLSVFTFNARPLYSTGVRTIKCTQIFICIYFSDKMYFLVHFCTNLKKIVQVSLPGGSFRIFWKIGEKIQVWNSDNIKNGTIKCSLDKSVFQHNRSIWGINTLCTVSIILIYMCATKNCDSSTHKEKNMW